jgi:DNA processing protein
MAPDPRHILLAYCAVEGVNWHAIARVARTPDGLRALGQGQSLERSTQAEDTARAIAATRSRLSEYVERAKREIEQARDRAGARLVTVLDDDYPANLRLIFNPPPFLFVQGHLERDDLRAVAVVGTREASEDGLRRARKMAAALTAEDVTVVSGLARGIDTAAHKATMEAGGRTIAVVGTGVLTTYPAENRVLAQQIAKRGAVVSQFWPSQPPAKHTFPMRNVTMSGIGQGTVVIEATHTSGAKLQARYAVQHGKLVFLVESLVTEQSWARTMLEKHREVMRITDPAEVIARLRAPDDVYAVAEGRRQLSLSWE